MNKACEKEIGIYDEKNCIKNSQPGGHADTYGMGAFISAGSEVFKMVGGHIK